MAAGPLALRLRPQVADQLVAGESLVAGAGQQGEEGELAALGGAPRRRAGRPFQQDAAEESERVHVAPARGVAARNGNGPGRG